ncbi:alcohol dehydrogenase catalytic domain-containing protein [Ideonella sp. A 288]|uniref:alcohol dehydrogenase catalytic domain-containing protein n=1 Tax=Ideonella sp. A 288 TaxID=1962181 RepID=UPI000B4C20B0|nr:alcohol dehydrogenase catalytic domain-containing protein [Ideonella sp. A 288]
MRAIRFAGARQVELIDRPWPEVPAGEVLLRVRRTALCGSDGKLWHKGAAHTPGHEIFGTVDQPGHDLHGQRSVVYIPVHCGVCAQCLAGQTHTCERESTLVGWNRDGGYGQALSVPEQCLLPVPDDIPDDLAPLLLDTIGTATHALRLVRPLLRDLASMRVLVTGAGPVGLGGLIALQDMGATDVHVADPRPHRGALAESMGARLHPVGDRSRRFDLVLESSGNLAARDQGLEVVAAQGVMLWVGENDEPWTVHESKPVRRKDFFLVRSFYFPKGDHAANIALLRRHRERYARLVDHVFDMAEMPQEFARFMAGERIKPLMRGGE